MTGSGLKIEHLPIDSLLPDPANPRQIDATELEALTRSLQQFGFVQPVVARREDKRLIGGHARLVAARRLGLQTVPVILLDIGVEQGRVLGLALNRIGGTFDQELLARLLADLRDAPDVDITLSGFTEDELQKVLRKVDAREKLERPETFDLEAALEDTKTQPVTKPGDLWVLGEHKLLCGNSTKPEDVTRLMDGQLASLLATDPPYLVDYTGGSQPASKSNKVNPKRDKH